MPEPQWLDAEEMRAWKALLSGWGLLEREIERQLKRDAGLSHAQYEVLVRLAAAPGGSLRMTELADSLINSKSRLSYQIDQLEKAGLVRRESHPTDSRGITAVLTEAGRHKLEDAAPGHVTLVRDLLIDVLTPGQLTALADGLGEVARRIRDDAE
ncbi:MarR family winged helix-turn-helix transcriptional regulator [Nocardia crassostreae]|uniref:MarR family winged helix-turn-helix transcriptional regulator n=1 Tax=Nocardia crassostreae TaxID=53428 RepID=UPI000834601A|nr:MarR family transcriptional regulator [Nocardia crassostreae]